MTAISASAYADAQHADTVYLTGATGLPVQDDLNARVTEMTGSFTAKTNAELATGLNHTTVNTVGVHAPVYSGGNRVTAVKPTYFETQVKDALVAGNLFVKGNFAFPQTYDEQKPFFDPMYLVEAAKQTGQKGY